MKYNVLNTYEANVTTVNNPYNFQQPQLFEMALRINKKRQFLFVSQVLGKHLALAPAIPILTSHLLAYEYMKQRFGLVDGFVTNIQHAIQSRQATTETLLVSKRTPLTPNKPVTVIGFAETATALGHGFFDKLTGDVQFVHTTRELLEDEEPIISFEEEHSHASSHRIYGNAAAFIGEREIILVDDEMTTGKTNRNIIRQLHEAFPHLKTFTLVSILDFRTAEEMNNMKALAQELSIEIYSVSLFNGNFDIQQIGELSKEQEQSSNGVTSGQTMISMEDELQQALITCTSFSENDEAYSGNYFKKSGRFGLVASEHKELEQQVLQISQKLKSLRTSGNCLVLGTGEFMYIPMLAACYLGNDVFFHATTRSPIYAHPHTVIKNKFTFNSAEFPGVVNYAYNIFPQQYTDIFIIYERVLDETAAQQLQAKLQAYAENVHIVSLGGVGNRLRTGSIR